ncbi:hypothetical protein BDY24DRAFT_437900 [Mrakia frigida]|uniref:uncharacterized protein n=1 Tax=Mrakia frigida TaxID=29902 RepID=UPI003FCBF97D
MGAWGEGIFQSDSDLDIKSEISFDAQLQLWYPNEKDLLKVQKAFNGGLLQKLTVRYLAARDAERVVLLAALAMQCGCEVGKEHREVVKKCLEGLRGQMFDLKRSQVKKALETYPLPSDGKPYDFDSPGLIETMERRMADRSAGQDAPVGMNVWEWGPEGKEGRDL